MSIGPMRSFWSNFAHVVRALAYCYANGAEGLTRVSQLAVLNANYLRVSIRDVIDMPYDELNRHEFVASAQSIKRETGVRALDIAKALLDRGYHAPTVYFPLLVPECIMIEPTETESKETLDGFVAALREILDRRARDAAVAARCAGTIPPSAASTKRAPPASPTSAGVRRRANKGVSCSLGRLGKLLLGRWAYTWRRPLRNGADWQTMRIKYEVSAGGLVLRRNGATLEALLIGRGMPRVWSLPKGHVEAARPTNRPPCARSARRPAVGLRS